MVTFECPFCDLPVGLEPDADEVRCNECSVILEFATEPVAAEVVQAA